MIKRLLRIIVLPIAMVLILPGIIQWVIMGRNIGIELMWWSFDGEWEEYWL